MQGNKLINTEEITWPRGYTNFIFECWKYLSRVSAAHSWEILSARENKICIPKRPCNVLIRSDEGLTLETSAFQSLYGGQFTLSTLLINQIFVFSMIVYSIMADGQGKQSINKTDLVQNQTLSTVVSYIWWVKRIVWSNMVYQAQIKQWNKLVSHTH